MHRQSPLHSDIGILILAPDLWADQWQTQHQLAARLPRWFHTAWMNPPRERTDLLKPSAWAAPPWSEGAGAPGLQVYSPEPWLPLLYRPGWPRALLERARLRRARRHLLGKGARRILLSLWRPHAVSALDLVEHDGAIYHVCDEYTYSAEEQPISSSERTLLSRASLTLFTSRELLARKRALAPRAEFLPNGVEFERLAADTEEPPDLRSIPRPRVGYTGWLKRQLDWDLIESAARRRPDVAWVLVGGVSDQPGLRERLAPITALPNVHFLGSKSTVDLARYPRHFDVCAMPYVVDGYTRYTYPLKLHEYFASGRPTIGTPIPAVVEFADEVRVGADASEWIAAIDELVATDGGGAAARSRRQELARAHDWDRIAERLAAGVLRLLKRG